MRPGNGWQIKKTRHSQEQINPYHLRDKPKKEPRPGVNRMPRFDNTRYRAIRAKTDNRIQNKKRQHRHRGNPPLYRISTNLAFIKAPLANTLIMTGMFSLSDFTSTIVICDLWWGFLSLRAIDALTSAAEYSRAPAVNVKFRTVPLNA
jgi:hypothetical protein